ncbi:MAG: lysophospholipid acyltransferase family protein [Spirochaetaceae bacterium]
MVVAPRWFNLFIKNTFGRFLLYRYNARCVGADVIEGVAPPYLLIPNHVNYWDPFLLGVFIPQPVYYVAADGNFRTRIMRRLLRLVGAIPKAKAKSDTATVRTMGELLRRGQIVGVFAEGQRTWDGESLSPLPATAKLLRLFKTTVVVPHLRGAYLSLPRWSPFRRKGALEIHFDRSRVLPAHRLKEMSLSEIDRWLREALRFSETDWQRSRRLPYPSRRQAEFAETLLYACPGCHGFSTLRSEGAQIRCLSCGSSVVMDRYGALSGHFEAVRDWNRWQQSHLDNTLREWWNAGEEQAFAKSGPLTLRVGRGSSPLRHRGTVTVRLLRSGLEVTPLRVTGSCRDRWGTEGWTIPFNSIHAVHVQLRQDLEFYYRRQLYVLRPTSLRESTHFWEMLITRSQSLLELDRQRSSPIEQR